MKKNRKKKIKKVVKKAERGFKQIQDYLADVAKRDPSKMLDLTLYGIAAYYGYRGVEQAIKKPTVEQKLAGAASAMVALKLAQSPNVIAGASGTAFLAGIGLLNIWNPLTEAATAGAEAIKQRSAELPFPIGIGIDVKWPWMVPAA